MNVNIKTRSPKSSTNSQNNCLINNRRHSQNGAFHCVQECRTPHVCEEIWLSRSESSLTFVLLRLHRPQTVPVAPVRGGQCSADEKVDVRFYQQLPASAKHGVGSDRSGGFGHVPTERPG